MATTPQHRQPTPERIFDTLNAYQRTAALRGAIDLDLFTAIDEGAAGDWDDHHTHYRFIVEALPRSPTAMQLVSSLDEMELLRDGIVNVLEMQLKALALADIENLAEAAMDFTSLADLENWLERR